MQVPLVDPIAKGAAITDGKGLPSPLFMRQWQNLIRLVHSTKTALANAATATTNAATAQTTANRCGVGFWVENVLSSNELVGELIFSKVATFLSGFPTGVAYAEKPAQADTTIRIVQRHLSGSTDVGTILFPAGANIGTLGGSVVTAPGDRLGFYGPATPDVTLGDISALLIGSIT